MPADLVPQAARKAIKNPAKDELKLGSVYPLHQGSNIWKIHCGDGQIDIELCIYVFAGSSLEQITKRIEHRLSAVL